MIETRKNAEAVFDEAAAWNILNKFKHGSCGPLGYYAHEFVGSTSYFYVRKDLRIAIHPCRWGHPETGKVKNYFVKVPESFRQGKWQDIHCWGDFNA